MAEVLRIYVII